jgi:energy-coupling factor transporter ATP-binding protein EcfA2
VIIEIKDGAAMPALTAALQAFLAPYFWQIADGTPHFCLIFREFAALPAHWREYASREITIRKSTAASFNLRGRALILEDESLVAIDEITMTAYHIDSKLPEIVFYGSSQSFIHLIEFVRYVSLALEEALGTMVLHAAATLDQGACYLILGEKGAGKTTTLLHLVQDHDHRYFSGDKVLVSQQAAGMLIRGWPDYPHVGVGTLQRFPSFARACGVALTQPDGTARPASQKELLDPATVRQALQCTDRPDCQRVAGLIFPTVVSEESVAQVIVREGRTVAQLRKHIEYPHQFETVRWHSLLADMRRTGPADYSSLLMQLLEPRWLRVTGTGEIPPALLATYGVNAASSE